MFGSKKLKTEIGELKATVTSLSSTLENLRENHARDLQLLRSQLAHAITGQNLDPDAILTGSPYSEIPSEKAADYISNFLEPFILDVRTEGEWRQGHIANAIHIDIREFESHVDKLPEDKSRPIVCFCAHGVRSAAACQIMIELGYRRLYNVEGGMSRYSGEVVVR